MEELYSLTEAREFYEAKKGSPYSVEPKALANRLTAVLRSAYIAPECFKYNNQYRFNEDGLQLVSDILDNYKSSVYKKIRKQKFDSEAISKAMDILGIAVSNNLSLTLWEQDRNKDSTAEIEAEADIVNCRMSPEDIRGIFWEGILSNHWNDIGISLLDRYLGVEKLYDSINSNLNLIDKDLVQIVPEIILERSSFEKRWSDIITKIILFRQTEAQQLIKGMSVEELNAVDTLSSGLAKSLCDASDDERSLTQLERNPGKSTEFEIKQFCNFLQFIDSHKDELLLTTNIPYRRDTADLLLELLRESD